MKCIRCQKEHNGLFGSGKYCSRGCANSRQHSDVTMKKISKSVSKSHSVILGEFVDIQRECPTCLKIFIIDRRSKKHQKFCSSECSRKHNHRLMSISGGKKSASSQNRRSKNEIYFGNLCKKHFKSVEFNTIKFNGWDADVIINDIKVAVLWNGKWHYEKITRLHSVSQVQTRDRLKIKEIENHGYIPYIVKDMGKYDESFVETEFNKFIAGWGSVCP